MIRKIRENIPLLSIGVFVLSILKLTIYYKSFEVPITSFISISELVLVVAGDLMLVGGVFTLFLFGTGFITKYEPELFWGKPKMEEPEQPMHVGGIILYSIIFILVIALCIHRFLVSRDFSVKFLAIFLILLMLYITAYIGWKDNRMFFPNKAEYLVSAFLISLIFIITVIWEVGWVKRGGKYSGTIIVTSDSTYISTDSSFYIGQTESYVFFYNKRDNHTSVIPTSEIKKIELHIYQSNK